MITHKTLLVVRQDITEFDYDEDSDEFFCPPKDAVYMRLYFEDLVRVFNGEKPTTLHGDMVQMKKLGWFTSP